MDSGAAGQSPEAANSVGSGTLDFAGVAIEVQAGQSVGAALLAAGIRSWRTTRKQGRPRGLFCGIGICYDCLITIDGVPDQRACLTPARPGMILETIDPSAPADEGEPARVSVPKGVLE